MGASHCRGQHRGQPRLARRRLRASVQRWVAIPYEASCAGLGEVRCSYSAHLHLADESPVLSDAIDVCSVAPAGAPCPKPEIHFADLVIETSAVIAIFLELVAKGQFAMWTNDFASCHAMCHAIAFMRKYECEVPLSILRLWAVNELLLRKIAPLYVFMVAAAMDDVDLSIMVFENRYVPVLGQDSVTSHGVPGIQDMKLLEAVLSLTPRGGEDAVWPFGLWTRFPAEYLWAVSKAWSKGCSKSSSGDRLYTLSQMTAMSSSAVGRRTLSSASTARTMSRPRSYESANFSDTDDRDCDFDMAREYRVAIRAVKALST